MERRPMTPIEKRMLRERIIREYKATQEKLKHNHNKLHDFTRIIRKTLPINIIIGLIASILLIYVKGWGAFLQLVLTGIIWITIISTAVAAVSKRN